MKREYKFRGKRIDNNEWVYGSLVVDTDKKNYSIIDYALEETNTYTWHNVFPNTVGQFIGLIDKQGKEIYEGDIVKIGRTKFTVEFRDCGFEMIGIGIVCVARLCSAYRDIEIIGNIYENSNLMEKLVV